MSCPEFMDYTRECTSKVEFQTRDIIKFCVSDEYMQCPIYRIIAQEGTTCKNTENCQIYGEVKLANFEKFIAMANQYCVSENCVNCQRYKIKELGDMPPIDLLPDGNTLKPNISP